MTSDSPPPDFLPRPDGQQLAYRRHAGDPARTGFVWLPGFRADMEGAKALALDAWARETGRSLLRFDYFGHGASSGDFAQGTIGRWRDDALAALDTLTEGRQVLVGSSMGGWIALLAAIARPERVAGLLLVAPAPDFTERLLWRRLPPEARKAILSEGVYPLPSDDGFPPAPITRALIEDGRRWLLFEEPSIPVTVPVRIVQGKADASVPWTHALDLAERLESPDVELILVPDGDHRLSRDADIARLLRTAGALGDQIDALSSASTAARPST